MDKHGIAALLIGKPMGAPAKEDLAEDEDVEKDEKLSVSALHAHLKNAAHEMLDAIKHDDAEKLCEAFCAMHGLDHALMDKEGEGEKEEPEGEEPQE